MLTLRCAERLGARNPFGDGPALNHVLLEDALATLRSHRAVPGAFRVNHKPRPSDANPKAASLGPHDGQLQLGAAALKIVPNNLALLHRRAVGAEAKEEVSLGAVDSGSGEAFVYGGVFGHG